MTNIQGADRNEPADELVPRARKERAAFGELFDHFYPQIYAYCTRRLVACAVAEDVASEVFLKVARGIHEFPGSCIEDFRRWLFRIATNEINAYLRQTVRRRQLLEAAAQLGKINACACTSFVNESEDVQWREVYSAIESLNDREQSIVSLRFFGGLKHEQIAEILHLNVGTIRVSLSRALDRMRDRLREGCGGVSDVGSSKGDHKNE